VDGLHLSWIKPELRGRVARKAAELPLEVVLVGDDEDGPSEDAEAIHLSALARVCLAHMMITGHQSLSKAMERALRLGMRRSLGLKSLHPVAVERRLAELKTARQT
jgi:hypothetical protein